MCRVLRLPFHVLSSRKHVLQEPIEILLEVLIISFGVYDYLLLILLTLLMLSLKKSLFGFELLLVSSILHLEEGLFLVRPIKLWALLSDGLEIREDKFLAIKVRDVLHAGKESIRQ